MDIQANLLKFHTCCKSERFSNLYPAVQSHPQGLLSYLFVSVQIWQKKSLGMRLTTAVIKSVMLASESSRILTRRGSHIFLQNFLYWITFESIFHSHRSSVVNNSLNQRIRTTKRLLIHTYKLRHLESQTIQMKSNIQPRLSIIMVRFVSWSCCRCNLFWMGLLGFLAT